MSKGKILSSKDKDFSNALNAANMINAAMESDMQPEPNEIAAIPGMKGKTPQVVIDYKLAYELALETIEELSLEVDKITQANEEVREAFINKLEGLDHFFQTFCVKVEFE